MSQSIRGVEIFAVGIWQGEKYTMDDLEEIARNFSFFAERVKVPLKFGHDEDQTLSGQSDGDPALGWVERVFVEGDKLKADFVEVPDLVLDIIGKGLYKQISVELSHTRHIGLYLSGVALLGADLPEVDTLQDLQAFLTANPPAASAGTLCGDIRVMSFAAPKINREKEIMPDDNKRNSTDAAMDDADQRELERLRTFKAQADKDAVTLKAEDEERVIRFGQREFTRQKDEVMKFAEEKVKAGLMEPRFRDDLDKALEEGARGFTEKSRLMVPAAMMVEAFTAASDKLKPGQKAGNQENDEPKGDISYAAECTKYMTEKGVTYDEASEAVSKINPELLESYTRGNNSHPVSNWAR